MFASAKSLRTLACQRSAFNTRRRQLSAYGFRLADLGAAFNRRCYVSLGGRQNVPPSTKQIAKSGIARITPYKEDHLRPRARSQASDFSLASFNPGTSMFAEPRSTLATRSSVGLEFLVAAANRLSHSAFKSAKSLLTSSHPTTFWRSTAVCHAVMAKTAIPHHQKTTAIRFSTTIPAFRCNIGSLLLRGPLAPCFGICGAKIAMLIREARSGGDAH